MPRELDVRYRVPENLTEEQTADARRALENLVKSLARISARACHELGIEFDMDDLEVAREVMKLTLDGLFPSTPNKPKRMRKAPKAKAG